MPAPILRTERLILRPWRESDFAPFRAMNADPAVRQYFPGTLTAAQSDASASRIAQHLADHDFGFWAIEVPGVADFIGFTGLMVPGFEAHFTPCVEAGWRLAEPYWGKGYATEAARAALAYGFGTLGLEEILAFTVPDNARSRRVMATLGMTRRAADDFDHPAVAESHPFRRHVLYRIRCTINQVRTTTAATNLTK